MTTIGERIKQRRIDLGLSQEEVALKAGYKSRSSVNKLESSRNLPISKIEKMAAALECSPAYLMGWEDENGEHIIDKNMRFFSGVDSLVKDYEQNIDNYNSPGMKFIKKDGSEYHFEVSSLIYEITESLMNMPTEKQEMIYDMVEGQNKRKKNIIYVSNPNHARISKSPKLNAAHERTDIEVTEEMKQHDDAFFDDED